MYPVPPSGTVSTLTNPKVTTEPPCRSVLFDTRKVDVSDFFLAIQRNIMTCKCFVRL